MTDARLREVAARAPLPDLAPTTFTAPDRPLAETRVAIVTTAALHGPTQEEFDSRADESFRPLPPRTDELRLGHTSQNYDRMGFLVDPNVVFPVDRLGELADEGVIGGVSPVHFSFLGNVRGNLETMRLDSGPAVARQLVAENVDSVLLTPVCPMCTRTVCVLARVLEDHGLRTTVLALVREHAVGLQPPRALHVDFPFGRPLGRPGDTGLQHRVLRSALSLLERPAGPLLSDFEETVESPAEQEPFACAMPVAYDGSETPAVAEARGLRPAFDRGLRLTNGRSGMRGQTSPDVVPAVVADLERLASSGDEPDDPVATARHALDVRCYFEVAGLALVEGSDVDGVTGWFFGSTVTGRMLRDLDARLLARAGTHDPSRALIPLAHRVEA